MRWIGINDKGRILCVGVAPADHDLSHLDYAKVITEVADDVRSETHYYNGTDVVQIPTRPNNYADFDFDLHEWVTDIRLVKDAAISEIKRRWKSEEKAGFIAYGKIFDSDDKAIQRILGAAQAAFVAQATGQTLTIDWTCADNSTLTMSAEMLIGIPVIIANAANALHQKYISLKAQIEGAGTIADIEAVAW